MDAEQVLKELWLEANTEATEEDFEESKSDPNFLWIVKAMNKYAQQLQSTPCAEGEDQEQLWGEISESLQYHELSEFNANAIVNNWRQHFTITRKSKDNANT